MTTPSVPSLGGIDMTKKQQYPVVYIAKPDGTVVGKLTNTLNISLKLKLGNINEYSFDVPFIIQQNGQFINNPVINLIRERYLFKMVFNNITEWYVIEEIQKTAADSSTNGGDTLTVTAYSLGYELADKLVMGFDALGVSLQTAMIGGQVTNSSGNSVTWAGVLSNSLWTLGYVDSSFNTITRTFKEDKITDLDAVIKIAQSFGAVIVWDTVNRQINFYKEENIGVDRGLRLSWRGYLNSSNYLQTFQRDSKTDQLVTRLHVYGKDGISINSVNTTGSDYIEDYSYFMQGFSQDSNGNVTGHSPWMSDDLCKAITNYNNKVQSDSNQYQNLLTQLTNQQSQLTTDQNTLENSQTNLKSAQSIVDTMNSTTDNQYSRFDDTYSGTQISHTATLNGTYYYAVLTYISDSTNVTYSIDGTTYTIPSGTWTVAKKINTGGSSSTVTYSGTGTNVNVTTIYVMISADEYAGNTNEKETLTTTATTDNTGNVYVTLSNNPNSGTVSVTTASGTPIPSADVTVSGTTVTIASAAGVTAGQQVIVSYVYQTNNNSTIISKYGVDWNQLQVNNAQNSVNTDNNNISSTQSQINSLQNSLSIPNNFTQAEIDEWSHYIIEKTFEEGSIDNPQQLYDDAKNEFATMNTPQIVFQISLANFLEDVRQQRNWDKFNLGDIVTIDYPLFNLSQVKAKLIEIDFDFENGDIQISIANTYDIRTGEYKFIDMLYQSVGTSATINMNSYKWEQAYSSSNQINDIINSTWDATKREITAGVNESVSINSRGIFIKDTTDPNKVLIAQAGVLAVSNDGGNTWKHAIRSDGIVGEQIYGKLIAGTNLTIDTDNGSFTVNENGVTIDGTKLTITNTSFLQAGTSYNGVTIDSTNGLIVVNSGSTVQTILNATDGIEIQTRSSSTASWGTVFGVDTHGNLYANNLITTSLKVQTNDATPQTLIDAAAKVINFSGFTQINGTINGNTNIASGTITGTNIASGTITNTNIANATITSAQIANATITDANISSVSANKITAGTVTSITINSSTLNSASISGGTISGTTSLDVWYSTNASILAADSNGTRMLMSTGASLADFNNNGNVYLYGSNMYLQPTTNIFIEPSGYTYFTANGNSTGMYMTSGSYGMIMRSSSANTGGVGISGTALYAVYTQNQYTTSSREHKTNIQDADIKQAHDLIRKISLKNYQYNKDIELFGSDNAKYRAGFIAEDAPHTLLNDDHNAVELYSLISHLVGAVQYLQQRVDNLENKAKEHDVQLNNTVSPTKFRGRGMSISYTSKPNMSNKPKLTGSGVAKAVGGIDNGRPQPKLK